jgi:glycogen debranching enzyme
MSYHNGSVWPHDTMLAAEGMARYGFLDQARTVASGMRDAAGHFGNSLPELFGGFSRQDFPVPVTYHHAGSPQAWAAAAGLTAVRLTAVPETALPQTDDGGGWIGGNSGGAGREQELATSRTAGP